MEIHKKKRKTRNIQENGNIRKLKIMFCYTYN